MADLGGCLVLLHDAHRRVGTLRATLRIWRRPREERAAFERFTQLHGTAGFDLVEDESAPEELTETVRLWFGRSGHVREEHDDEYGTTVSVRKGDLWWQLDADGYATTNADDPEVPNGVAEEFHWLLEPAGFLAGLVLESVGDGQVAGRATFRARALPREMRHPEQLPLLYQVGGGDDYGLDIDAERGTLLRVEARIDGVPFLVHEVTEVVFDEPFEPELFELAAPAGERFRAVTEDQPTITGVTLEQVVALAPFKVWAPAELPPGWRLEVTFVAAGERWDLAPTVFLHYSANDASHWFTIQQWQEGHRGQSPGQEDWGAGPWQVELRAGRRLEVGRLDKDSQAAGVRLELEGTAVLIQSRNLHVEWLADIAAGLAPAPSTPPEPPPPATRS